MKKIKKKINKLTEEELLELKIETYSKWKPILDKNKIEPFL